MLNLSALLLALVVSTALLFLLRPLAAPLGLIDRPGGRKTHSGEIPIIGGIAMFPALAVAALLGTQSSFHEMALLLAAALMVAVGAIDDRRQLPPGIRLTAHLLAALGLVYGTGCVVVDLGNLLGFGTISLEWLAWPFTLVACVALINAFNMLDGLDGLAGGVALCALGGMATIAGNFRDPMVLVVASSMTGAVLGFLLFNLPARYNRRVRVFMGDAGSTLLGFVLAALALVLIQPRGADTDPVIILWLLPIPIFELFTSTVRRLVKGMSPAEADTGHFHHRLLAAGFSVKLIFCIYLVVSGCSTAFAVYASSSGIPEVVLAAGFFVFFALWLLFVRSAPSLLTLIPKSLRRVGGASLH